MRKKTYLRGILAALTCLAVIASCVCTSGFAAFATDEAPARSSEWEMTVPQIRITTENGNGNELQKEDGYQNASVSITDTDGTVLEDDCTIKIRGNTTALSWITKKGYNFKFSKKKDVLGMGKGKKWALVANVFDPSLLRNYLAFSLGKELGLDYTSEFKIVEMWMDGSFRGCYMLFEPVQEGTDRVDIDIESNEGKKDFLLEYESKRVEEGKSYVTVDGVRFMCTDPEEPDEEQLAYITETMQDIVTTIRTGTQKQIAEKIDVPSFAKFYLLNEYFKTFDFDVTSVYFYYKDGKLYAGPPWDYDLGSGNANPEFSSRAEGTHNPEGIFCKNKNIYRYLGVYDWFHDEVREVYREHYGYFSSIYADGGVLDSARAQYADVFARNYNEAGWRVSRWWINIQMQPFETYEQNFEFLKNWCKQRNNWLSDYYGLIEHDYIRGDADGNGKVDVNDATYIQRVLAEQVEVPDREKMILRADVNGNGLSVDDATAIQRYLAEYGNEYGIGEIVAA